MWTMATVAPTATTVTATMVKWGNIQSCRQSKCLPHLLHTSPSLFHSLILCFSLSSPTPSPSFVDTSLSLSLSGTRIYAQFLFTNFGKCRTSVCPLCVCVCVCVRYCAVQFEKCD